ncbi:MAG: hypothetical protein PWR13_996 [Archaeoglobi archaeon]|nr:hypothetical protein [Archaeoglobi archaeon]
MNGDKIYVEKWRQRHILLRTMKLDEYLKNINKMGCGECKFNREAELRERPIIIIPPPEKVRAVLISRDPTVYFLPFYRYSKNFTPEEQRRILFAFGIPDSLYCRS